MGKSGTVRSISEYQGGIKMVLYEQNTERNTAFDLIKIVCTLIIILHHSGFFYGVLNRGYIAVEFFFITSGYFLYRSYINRPNIKTIQYFLKRAKRLYPEYWFAFVMLIITGIFLDNIPYKHWYSPLLELTLLQNIGLQLDFETMNYPCWYLSVLLFAGTLIYCCLRKFSKVMFNIIAFIIVFVVYLTFIVISPDIEQWNTVGYFFYLPFWRGVADLLIGIFIYQLPKIRGKVGVIIECTSGMALMSLLIIKGKFDYIAVGLIILFIWTICSEKSIVRKIGSLKIIRIISKYQYGMYVNHICIIFIFWNFGISTYNVWVASVLLFICIFSLSYIDNMMINQIKRRLQNINVYDTGM